MKKLIAITSLLTLFTIPVFAADYSAITKDNEETSVEAVKVKESVTTTRENVLTLQSLRNRKALLEGEIAEKQGELAKVEAQITAVDNVAKVIKLKVEAEPK